MLHLGFAQRLEGNASQRAQITVGQDIVEDTGYPQVAFVCQLLHITAGKDNVVVEMGGQDIPFTPFTPRPKILFVQERPVAVAEPMVIANAPPDKAGQGLKDLR